MRLLFVKGSLQKTDFKGFRGNEVNEKGHMYTEAKKQIRAPDAQL